MKIKSNYVDIANKKVFPALIEIVDNKIASITQIDAKCSTYILPGFVDAHIHIESSMLIPSEFARLALRHGSIATVSDPHEIANVMGVEGIEFMLSNAKEVNFHFNFGVSPCVPATPFETSGASLDSKTVKELLSRKNLNHLSEVMAFPNVISGEKEIMSKISYAKELHLPIDGHAPLLRGEDLKKYIDAGISTDHEASSYEEAKEKLELGMKILIREGSAAKNYEALSPLITEYPDRLMFCSDDKHPNDLLRGHINELVVRSIKNGYDIFDVLKIACINPKVHYNLDIGQLQVGDKADFIEVKNLEDFEIVRTFINAEVVFENAQTKIQSLSVEPINNFHAKKITSKDLLFQKNCDSVEVIEVIDHELFTLEKKYHAHQGDIFNGDVSKDILKIVVLNRYKEAPAAISFIKGFHLKNGAIASSIAHDSHNIIAVGCSDEEITQAINLIVESKGGISALNTTTTLHLPLNIAGIMSNHDAFEVAERYESMDTFVKNSLGSSLSAPFMTLSFMALLVIPEIKLSDKGLFDGREFHFIPTCIT